jgi:phage host-nuclease inhibitor protein Gam
LQHLKAKNDTQTDLRTIGELQAEINRLREENAKMFELLEMVARGITLMCDTEDVIRITSAVKKFCIAKRESEE